MTTLCTRTMLSFALLLICRGSAASGAEWGANLRAPCAWLSPACGVCPDNYCVKPLPPVTCPPAQCCADTYCRKPLPGVTAMSRGCGDDCYQAKPWPAVPCCSEPWYRCGVGSQRP